MSETKNAALAENTGVLPNGVHILVTRWEDGTVTAAIRRSRWETWSKPVDLTVVDATDVAS